MRIRPINNNSVYVTPRVNNPSFGTALIDPVLRDPKYIIQRSNLMTNPEFIKFVKYLKNFGTDIEVGICGDRPDYYWVNYHNIHISTGFTDLIAEIKTYIIKSIAEFNCQNAIEELKRMYPDVMEKMEAAGKLLSPREKRDENIFITD